MQTFKTRAEFQRVQKGRKWVTPAFILQGLPRPAGEERGAALRFHGFEQIRRQGKGGAKKRGMAVDRNRARRRLKEAVRLTFPAHAKPGFDYAIIGRAAALTQDFAALLADMEIAFHKVSQPARPASGTNSEALPAR